MPAPAKRGEAERRQAHPTNVRAYRSAEAHPTGRARLSALHRGSRLGDRTPPLSLGPRFLKSPDANGLLALSDASAASSSQTGHSAGRAGSRSRPGAGLQVPPAGAALAPQSGSHPDAPVDERDLRLVTEMRTNVKKNVALSATISQPPLEGEVVAEARRVG